MPISTRIIRLKNGTSTTMFQADAGRNPITRSRKERRKLFKLKRDATEWLHHAEKSILSIGTLTLRQLGVKHVADRKANQVERSTHEKYDQHFRNHINPLTITDADLDGTPLGDVPVAMLRPRHFVAIRARLKETLSGVMARKAWRTLISALDHAVVLREIELNPATSVKMDRKKRLTPNEVVKAQGAPKDIPTEEDIGKLLAAIDFVENEPPTLGQVFVSTKFRTGGRPSELRALTWPDFVLHGANPTVTITKRVDEYGVLGDVKSANAHRTIPLPPTLVSMLLAWREVCPRNAVVEVRVGRRGSRFERMMSKNLNPRDLVFPTRAGGYQNPSNMHRRVWVPIQLALGLKDPVLAANGTQRHDRSGQPKFKHRYRLYSLRHVYASVQIRLGMNLKQLQIRMGHSSIQQTMDTYGHLWHDAEADAAAAVGLDAHYAALKARAPNRKA